jgi:hypothetical protein
MTKFVTNGNFTQGTYGTICFFRSRNTTIFLTIGMKLHYNLLRSTSIFTIQVLKSEMNQLARTLLMLKVRDEAKFNQTTSRSSP